MPSFEESPPTTANAAFLKAFRRSSFGNAMPFARFMDLALYHPDAGYYRRDVVRIGREPGTDFLTSSSFKSVFQTLVAAALRNLEEGETQPGPTLVEAGAEAQGGLFKEPPAGFAACRTIQIGDDLSIPERAVVFSNELFDAQPFHRLKRIDGNWRERGVTMIPQDPSPKLNSVPLEAERRHPNPLETGCPHPNSLEAGCPHPARPANMPPPPAETPGSNPSQKPTLDDHLTWTDLPEWSPEVRRIASRLPATAPDGYILDLPIGTETLCRKIVAKPWTGWFVAFDYGLSWEQISQERPEGTLRAYRRHRMQSDLLAHPGEQDLTGHICWDWMEAALAQNGFRDIRLMSQEAFFVRHARAAIETIATRGDSLAPERRALQELLHPARFGQKFQVLLAHRRG